MDVSTTTVLWLAGIFTGAVALQFGRRVFVNRVFNKLGREDKGRVIALREITQSALRWAIWLTTIIVALGTLGVDVGALIALFGIAGLAISFGAQSFIKDLISYVVFVFADNFRIGEEVLMDGKRGRIQKFEMGSVVLVCGSDDEAPYLVYVPYGKIATVENYSRSLDEA
ncbi:MAG: mechanosensitive ion channel domain-containing protein [Acidimicrobiia bacterium]